MNPRLFEQLRTLAADVLRVPPSLIGEASTPQEIESWDSIQHVSLVLAIEERFGVVFDPDEISHMNSVGKIGEILSTKVTEPV